MITLNAVSRVRIASLIAVSVLSTNLTFGQSVRADTFSGIAQSPILETSDSVEPTTQETEQGNDWSDPQLVNILFHSFTDFDHDNIVRISTFPGLSNLPIDISSDSRTLVSVGTNSIRLWNLVTGEEVASPLQLTQGATGWHARSVAFSPDGQRLSVASDKLVQFQGGSMPISAEGVVEQWDLVGRRQVAIYTGGASFGGHQVIWGDAGLAFYGRCSNNRSCIRVFDGNNQDGLNIPAFASFGAAHQFFAIHHAERVLATVSSDLNDLLQIDFVDLQNGSSLGSFNLSGNNQSSLEGILEDLEGIFDRKQTIIFSPDESLLAVSQNASEVYILETAELRQQLSNGTVRGFSKIEPDYESQIVFMAISPDNQVLATASEEGAVKLWDTSTGDLITTIDSTVTNLAFSPDGQYLALSSGVRTIEVFSPR